VKSFYTQRGQIGANAGLREPVTYRYDTVPEWAGDDGCSRGFLQREEGKR